MRLADKVLQVELAANFSSPVSLRTRIHFINSRATAVFFKKKNRSPNVQASNIYLFVILQRLVAIVGRNFVYLFIILWWYYHRVAHKHARQSAAVAFGEMITARALIFPSRASCRLVFRSTRPVSENSRPSVVGSRRRRRRLRTCTGRRYRRGLYPGPGGQLLSAANDWRRVSTAARARARSFKS